MPKSTQSTQYAAQVAAAANFAARIDDKRQIMGDVQFATIVCPVTADNVANDVITLVQLPAGAIVLPELSKVLVTADMNDGAMTIDIGDIVDPDRYADGVDVAAAGLKDFLTSAFAAGLATRTPCVKTDVSTTDTSLVTLTIATEAGTMAAGSMTVVLAYKCL